MCTTRAAVAVWLMTRFMGSDERKLKGERERKKLTL